MFVCDSDYVRANAYIQLVIDTLKYDYLISYTCYKPMVDIMMFGIRFWNEIVSINWNSMLVHTSLIFNLQVHVHVLVLSRTCLEMVRIISVSLLYAVYYCITFCSHEYTEQKHTLFRH